MKHVIIKADKGVGYEFDSFMNKPNEKVTGRCWVYVNEYKNGLIVGSYAYCNDPTCNCFGFIRYF